MSKTIADAIQHLYPCEEALGWAKNYPAIEKQKAWDVCQRGDWMLWLLAKRKKEFKQGRAEHKKLVLIACKCARLSLPYTNDIRVLACIEMTEKWIAGTATIQEVEQARAAAGAARAAAWAAAWAARAAAGAAAARAAEKEFLTKSAHIVRECYPKPPVIRKAA